MPRHLHVTARTLLCATKLLLLFSEQCNEISPNLKEYVGLRIDRCGKGLFTHRNMRMCRVFTSTAVTFAFIPNA